MGAIHPEILRLRSTFSCGRFVTGSRRSNLLCRPVALGATEAASINLEEGQDEGKN
jgi:hypothetical protein